MFLEYYVIDWWWVISNFVWILGAAIILSAFSYYEFLTWRQKIRRTEIFRRTSFKKSFFLGLILLAAGLIFSLINFKNDSSLTRLKFIDTNIYNPNKIEKYDIGELLIISTHEMEMNKKYRIRNNLIEMPWSGYVGTPFINFASGHYTVEFEAHGSEAGNEFSKIWVIFLVIENKKLALHKFLKQIELTETKKKYSLKFEAEENKIGRIRIQFFNDGSDDKGGDRNVWIGKVKIRKLIGDSPESF